jgi:hypothetical protein
LTCENCTATLCGLPADVAALFAASERGSLDNREKPHPIFILTKGRPKTALLGWKAPHVLGDWCVPFVIVVEPQEEEVYRNSWPDALFLVLPRPADSAIGYTRWVVQHICTCSHDTAIGRTLCLPWVWMADDLLVAFYYLEKPFGLNGSRILSATPTASWSSEGISPGQASLSSILGARRAERPKRGPIGPTN